MIIVPPEWIVKPVDQAAVEGQDVVFQCRVAGIPLPTVTWRKLDKSKFFLLLNTKVCYHRSCIRVDVLQVGGAR